MITLLLLFVQTNAQYCNDHNTANINLLYCEEITNPTPTNIPNQSNTSKSSSQDLFLNLTLNKNTFVDTEYDGLNFGLRIYNYIPNQSNTSKSSSPIQDINYNSLQHQFTMSFYFSLTLWNLMLSETP
eukprot:970980_1